MVYVHKTDCHAVSVVSC